MHQSFVSRSVRCRSGKSSIQKVVFHKMSPNETLFLESTNKIAKSDVSNSSFIQFQIWDFPGQIDYFDGTFDAEEIFGKCGALVFVIDAQVRERERERGSVVCCVPFILCIPLHRMRCLGEGADVIHDKRGPPQ
jgi:hypothetical protein